MFQSRFRVNNFQTEKENNKFSLDDLFLLATPTRAIYDEEGKLYCLGPITDEIASNYEADIN